MLLIVSASQRIESCHRVCVSVSVTGTGTGDTLKLLFGERKDPGVL